VKVFNAKHAKEQSHTFPFAINRLDYWIKEQFIMRKTIYALGGLAAFILVGFLIWNAFRPADEGTPVVDGGETAVITDTPTDAALNDVSEETDTGSEPVEPVEEPDGTDTTDSTDEIIDLPALPKIQGGQQSSGLGGGGGAAVSESLEAESLAVSSDLMIDPYFTDVFSGTLFTTSAPLPTDITQAIVWQQANLSMELAEAQQIAAAFGFTGQLYVMPTPTYVDEAGVEHVEKIPVTYFAFDGTKALTIDAYGTYYRDESIEFTFESELPLEQISPIAELFVLENGLVDYEYEMDRLWGNEVLFYRLIDGRRVNQPEVTVSITDEGEIAFASNQKLRNLAELGNYPLRTAEEAFQLLQSGIIQNNIWYNYIQSGIEEPIPTEPFVEPFDEYRFWQRTFAPGEEAHVYTWPNIYLPADGNGAPMIQAWPFTLTGSDEMLQEIAAAPNNQFHFWGVVSEDGRNLTLTGWETLSYDRDSIFLQGNVRYDGDRVLFDTFEGETYIVPDAPADLPTDETLNIFGWAFREVGAEFMALDWESIDILIDYSDEPIAIEEPMIIDEPFIYEPYVYQNIDITSAELIYAYSYIYPEYDESAVESDTMLREFQMPTVILQPAWKLTGTADNGDIMEFIVEGVSPEYTQSQ
jgi:hypothetical protein